MDNDNIPIKKVPASNQINPSLDIPPEMRKALENDVAEATLNTTSTPAVSKFPTEVIDLPSKGYFYSSDSPLSTGQIELKFMTAKEEDILTSQNLIKKGIVLDKLLEALIVTPGVSLEDILIGDKNAIFVASRVLAYGPSYDTKVKCPSCGTENKTEIPLDKLENKPFDFNKHVKGNNTFSIDLPTSKKLLTYSLISHKEEKLIDQELKAMAKVNKNGTSPEVTTRLKYMIKSVDGDSSTQTIRNFVDNELLSRDALALRKHVKENSPDLDMTMNFDCEECGHQEVISIPMGVDFFWPDSGV